MTTSETPYGYCHCGCGEKTQIATMTQKACGWVKGEPKRYVFNHHRRKHVDAYWTVEDQGYATPCWVWTGKPTDDGYARMHREGRNWYAHVWYYEQAKGPVPEGKQLDHLCHTNCAGGPSCPHRLCVNPDHLEPVPQKVNNQRGVKARGKPTHCKRGHEYTPENTLVGSDGAWRCRECQKTHMRAYYLRRKGGQP